MVTHCGCCCCCCCLHTVGGLIGASIGSALGRDDYERVPVTLPDEEALRPFRDVQARRAGRFTDEEPMPRRPYRDLEMERRAVRGSGGVGLYWLSLLLLSVFISCAGFPPRIRAHDPAESVWILAFFMPAIQLGASVLALLGVLLLRPENQAAAVKKIGKITLGMVLGTLAGSAVMMLTCGLSPLGLFR
jgi:hypothetical protein